MLCTPSYTSSSSTSSRTLFFFPLLPISSTPHSSLSTTLFSKLMNMLEGVHIFKKGREGENEALPWFYVSFIYDHIFVPTHGHPHERVVYTRSLPFLYSYTVYHCKPTSEPCAPLEWLTQMAPMTSREYLFSPCLSWFQYLTLLAILHLSPGFQKPTSSVILSVSPAILF